MTDGANTYLFEYDYGGVTWELQIKAADREDALRRVQHLSRARYVGKLEMTIYVPTLAGRIFMWLRKLTSRRHP